MDPARGVRKAKTASRARGAVAPSSGHGNEVDFVLARRGAPPTAIECTWRAVDLDAASLRAFRGAYPGGANYLVASDGDRPNARRYGDLVVRCVAPAQLIDEVTRPHGKPR